MAMLELRGWFLSGDLPSEPEWQCWASEAGSSVEILPLSRNGIVSPQRPVPQWRFYLL
jgi:hypothetical protein